MAKIINISLPTAPAKKTGKNIPAVHVPGDIVTQFNEARDAVDRAQEVINELKPELVEAGIEAVFSHNCAHADDPKQVISSVNLVDEESGEVVQFSWSKKNLKNDPDRVQDEFNRLTKADGKKVNVNDFVAYEPQSDFDDSVFMVDGKFDQARYDAFRAALDEVSETFGVKNPLSTFSVLKPKPGFHEERWSVFDMETNRAIQTVLPTQVSLEPMRGEEPEPKAKRPAKFEVPKAR